MMEEVHVYRYTPLTLSCIYNWFDLRYVVAHVVKLKALLGRCVFNYPGGQEKPEISPTFLLLIPVFSGQPWEGRRGRFHTWVSSHPRLLDHYERDSKAVVQHLDEGLGGRESLLCFHGLFQFPFFSHLLDLFSSRKTPPIQSPGPPLLSLE